jgi:hypothetical protein
MDTYHELQCWIISIANGNIYDVGMHLETPRCESLYSWYNSDDDMIAIGGYTMTKSLFSNNQTVIIDTLSLPLLRWKSFESHVVPTSLSSASTPPNIMDPHSLPYPRREMACVRVGNYYHTFGGKFMSIRSCRL